MKKKEARTLFCQGLLRGMVSRYAENGLPKYVWAVDQDGEVYGFDDRAARIRDAAATVGAGACDARRPKFRRPWSIAVPARFR